jgi:hypothetical protein
MLRRLFALTLFCAALTAAATHSAARYRAVPPTIDLGIPNISQETRVWCWAAVAQQVIQKRRGYSPPQCALVAMVNGRYPSFCCPNYDRCATPGSLRQIQALIRNFGHRASHIAPPSDAMTLYRELRAGRPIIIAIRNADYSGHVVVLTGMSWHNTGRGVEAVLHINDPLHTLAPRVLLSDILPRWAAAIIVY